MADNNKIECPRCNAQSAEGNRFCSTCGAPLGTVATAPARVFDAQFRDRVRQVTNEDYESQTLLEIETVQAIASRLAEWAKLLGFFVGIPVGLLLLILAVLGVKTYTDFETLVGTKQKEVVLRLDSAQKTAAKLEADGAGLAAKYAQLQVNFNDTAALAAQVTHLSDKVDLIGAKLGFTPTSNVTDKLRSQLRLAFASFQRYLNTVGYRETSKQIKLDIRDDVGTGAVANYDANTGTMIIQKRYASVPDFLNQEYMHHVLYGRSGIPDGSLSAYSAIESGLATYFPCSYRNSPRFGEDATVPPADDSFLDLSEKRPFGDLRDDNDATAAKDGAEIWGAAFWEMRRVLGQAAADKLLFDAWQAFPREGARTDGRKHFVQRLIEADSKQFAARYEERIRNVFIQRGMTL